MGSFTLHPVSFYNYGSGTWTSKFSFSFDLSDLPYESYDIKYFYHAVGTQDPTEHWGNLNVYGADPYFTLQLWPRQTYVFSFELWNTSSGYNTGSYLSNYYVTPPPPPIALWSWDNSPGSYNYKYKSSGADDHSSYLAMSKAAAYSGVQTVNFQRQTWNDLIDWLIYAYKIAANNENVTDQSFYPSGTSGRAYLTSYQSHPDPIIFRASNWNLMSYIGNSTAIALGGNSFISSVSTGNIVQANIFSNVIDEINRLINIFNY